MPPTCIKIGSPKGLPSQTLRGPDKLIVLFFGGLTFFQKSQQIRQSEFQEKKKKKYFKKRIG